MEPVKIVVKNATSKILNLEDLDIIDKISYKLSYTLDSDYFLLARSFQHRGWDGRHRLLNKKLEFPTGCLHLVRSVLDEIATTYEVEDLRKYHTFQPTAGWTGFELRDYQQNVVSLAHTEKHGMFQVATGGGKTLCMARIAYELNIPTVIYVVSLDLLLQVQEELANSIQVPIGIVGGGLCDIQKITVCSVWTAGKIFSKKNIKSEEGVTKDNWSPGEKQKKLIKEMVLKAQCIMLDEAQFAAAESIKVILTNSAAASYRFGFSASPWRSNGDDILLEAAFGRKLCEISASSLIERGVLVPPTIFFKDAPKFTEKLPKDWMKVKSSYIVNNDKRNRFLIDQVLKLLELGRRPLLLFKEHQHGENLKALLPDDLKYGFVSGRSSMDERKQVVDNFINNKFDLIIASTVYDQGINLKSLDALVLADPGKSTAKALQRVGRVIRGNEGKTNAIIIDLYDDFLYVNKHCLSRWKIYNTEPRFQFKVGKKFAFYADRNKAIWQSKKS